MKAAGLRSADEILPAEDDREGLELDRGRVEIAHGLDPMDNVFGEAQVLK
jgi:hypothetical protein